MKKRYISSNQIVQKLIPKLEGPEGCHFRKNRAGKITWKCDHTHRKTKNILKKMGYADDTIDCEILFNGGMR